MCVCAELGSQGDEERGDDSKKKKIKTLEKHLEGKKKIRPCSVKSSFETSGRGSETPRRPQPRTTTARNRDHRPKVVLSHLLGGAERHRLPFVASKNRT